MDKRLEKTIDSVQTWEQLNTLERNIWSRNAMTSEVEMHLAVRSRAIARAVVSEKTGLPLTGLSPAEEKIVLAVAEFVDIRRRDGKQASRTFLQIRNRGLIGAAEASVEAATPTPGFQILTDEDREDLSYEQIIVDHPDEFSPRAQWYSRRTLGLPNSTTNAPAEADGDTQTKTENVLRWLASKAAENGGLLPKFSNQTIANLLGTLDMQQYGRALGNIQSRLDFSCYRRGLPPIGLAADESFARAWSQQSRSWAFPVDAMRHAARNRTWTQSDFDALLSDTETLPGQASKLWAEAISSNEANVKKWAYSFDGPTYVDGSNGDQGASGPSTVADAGDWNEAEVDAAVVAYLEMLQHEQAGRTFNKAEYNRNLRSDALSRRSKGSIEFRMQNISSVLLDHYLPWIQGYKPAANVGRSVHLLIEESLERHGVFLRSDYDPTSEIESLEDKVKRLRKKVFARPPPGRDKPEVQVVSTTAYIRDPAVKAWVLQEANGICEGCGNPAPFVNDDGEPFLEVHHIRLLAAGGADRVTNAAALCPNCHRRCHHSSDRDAFKTMLYRSSTRLRPD